MFSNHSPQARSSASARVLPSNRGVTLGMMILLLLFLLAFPKEAAAIEVAANEVAANTADIEIKVGQLFPSLKLPTLDGEIRSIEDFRGTKVVLHVFSSW